MVKIDNLDFLRHASELRDTWQAKVLAAAKGRMIVAIPSILAHTYDEAMPTLMRLVRPLCWDPERLSLRTPFLCSIAKVDKAGRIVADAVMHDYGIPQKDKVIFASERDFEYELRKLADLTRLDDKDRIEFFKVAKRWVAADRRLDPNMDFADPDAKRLVDN